MFLAGVILYGLLSILIPVAIIVLIIRLIMRHRDEKNGVKRPFLQFREVMLSTFVLAAGYTGVAGLYVLPFALFGEGEEFANQVLATHLISAIALLIIGLLIKEVTGKFLMVVGLLLLIGAIGPAFSTLGSAGALVAVVLAFAVLIGITIHVSRKAQSNG